MMRAAGVPARVVTGYQGGEWNPIRQYFLIRQSDAHAWAEVWLDGEGWTRVDPTAVVAPGRLNRGLLDLLPDTRSIGERVVRNVAWLTKMRQRWDAVNDWWNESVVKYDMRTQLSVLRWLGFDEPDWRVLGYLLAAGLIGWLLVIAWHVGRTSRGDPGDRLARAYARLCAKLARAGAPREPHEGPLAYALAISSRRPISPRMRKPCCINTQTCASAITPMHRHAPPPSPHSSAPLHASGRRHTTVPDSAPQMSGATLRGPLDTDSSRGTMRT